MSNSTEYSRHFFKDYGERADKAEELLREALQTLDLTRKPEPGIMFGEHNLAAATVALAKIKASEALLSGEYVRFIENE